MESVEGDPYPLLSITLHLLYAFSAVEYLQLLAIIVLIMFSALLSGSESAFFSLRQEDLLELQDKKGNGNNYLLQLHQRPKTLLATILIGNTLVNIMIAIMATRLLGIIDYGGNENLEFVINVILVTFVLVLLGEVVPKVYASHHNLRFATFMSLPLHVLSIIFSPLSFVLSRSTSLIEQRLQGKGHQVSLDEIKHAIEITSGEATSQEEKKILRGIINFGNTSVKQIMRSRVDVVAHDINTPFAELIKHINNNRYSRLPIYNGSFDKIEGLLYIKDLIPHLKEEEGYAWQSLLRDPYYVPETKKIDDLLQEFRIKKVHLAIVVDEYGGTAGIVTLEDVLEEIVGDINDEFDDDEIFYSRLDSENFVFEGKTALTDVIRIMSLDDEVFDKVKGDAETIGGMVAEISGKIPAKDEVIALEEFNLTVELADRRRVRRVKVSRMHEAADEHES